MRRFGEFSLPQVVCAAVPSSSFSSGLMRAHAPCDVCVCVCVRTACWLGIKGTLFRHFTRLRRKLPSDLSLKIIVPENAIDHLQKLPKHENHELVKKQITQSFFERCKSLH